MGIEGLHQWRESMRTYRILVGPYVMFEYTVLLEDIGTTHESQELGKYMVAAAERGQRVCGPNHEVRVLLYKRDMPQ